MEEPFGGIMNPRIAVDFDGTIVEHKYPEIGEPKLFAFETLRALQKKGFRLILWTFRIGKELEEAVEFCRQHGVEFYAVNKNYPEEVFDETVSRKIDADVYIDDKNLGGFPGWSEVWKMLVPDDMERREELVKRGGRRRLFGGLWGRRRGGMVLHLMLTVVMAWLLLQAGGCKGKEPQGAAAVPPRDTATGQAKGGIFPHNRYRVVFLRPKEELTFQAGEAVPYEVRAGDSLDRPDSLVVYVDNRRLAAFAGGEAQGVWQSGEAAVGIHALKAVSYKNGKRQKSKTLHLVLTSNYVPRKMTYEVVKVYPHDRKAYTQGLVYEEGYMYEGTGLRGASTLRKWELESGKVVESRNLPPDLFGEGIAILGDRIYQLTWTSRTAFVYDKATFSLLRKLRYSTQGWGLTTDGTYLIMSDGSNHLYFLDPQYFTEVRRISVYDDRGPVDQLNELEYIDSTIYANVYQTDEIVRIDPACGKVLERINLRGILPKKEYRSDTDVLNGIAWDPEGRRIFVTGKNWPKLFEVRFVPVH